MPNNSSIEIAGKSVAISIQVPKLNPLEIAFKDEQEKVKQALLALSELEKTVSLK